MNQKLGTIRQNGYVVKDIHAAMDYWTNAMGVGPWFYVENVDVDWFKYRGVDSDLDMSVALANSGDLQIELIRQNNDAPSLYKDFLDAGREGLQHHAFWSTNYQALYDELWSRGFTLGHEGQIGGDQGRFAYFDSDSHPGTVIEISDISGPKGKLFEFIRQAAVDWDGSEPIRKV